MSLANMEGKGCHYSFFYATTVVHGMDRKKHILLNYYVEKGQKSTEHSCWNPPLFIFFLA
jgi:hypothetical protein